MLKSWLEKESRDRHWKKVCKLYIFQALDMTFSFSWGDLLFFKIYLIVITLPLFRCDFICMRWRLSHFVPWCFDRQIYLLWLPSLLSFRDARRILASTNIAYCVRLYSDEVSYLNCLIKAFDLGPGGDLVSCTSVTHCTLIKNFFYKWFVSY